MNGITLRELVECVEKSGIGMDVEILPLGTQTKYVYVDRDNNAIVLDEEQCDNLENISK